MSRWQGPWYKGGGRGVRAPSRRFRHSRGTVVAASLTGTAAGTARPPTPLGQVGTSGHGGHDTCVGHHTLFRHSAPSECAANGQASTVVHWPFKSSNNRRCSSCDHSHNSSDGAVLHSPQLQDPDDCSTGGGAAGAAGRGGGAYDPRTHRTAVHLTHVARQRRWRVTRHGPLLRRPPTIIPPVVACNRFRGALLRGAEPSAAWGAARRPGGLGPFGGAGHSRAPAALLVDVVRPGPAVGAGAIAAGSPCRRRWRLSRLCRRPGANGSSGLPPRLRYRHAHDRTVQPRTAFRLGMRS